MVVYMLEELSGSDYVEIRHETLDIDIREEREDFFADIIRDKEWNFPKKDYNDFIECKIDQIYFEEGWEEYPNKFRITVYPTIEKAIDRLEREYQQRVEKLKNKMKRRKVPKEEKMIWSDWGIEKIWTEGEKGCLTLCVLTTRERVPEGTCQYYTDAWFLSDMELKSRKQDLVSDINKQFLLEKYHL